MAGKRRPRGHFERLGAPSSLLGSAPDAEVAELLGLSVHHVREARLRRGIQSRWNTAHTIEWSRVEPLLGTRPDAQLAREVGVSVASINERRRALGIPVHAPTRTCACRREFAAYVSGAEQRFCSTDCAYAARWARKQGGHEDLSVALWALRREVRRHGG